MYRVVLSILVICLALTACGGKATPGPAEVAHFRVRKSITSRIGQPEARFDRGRIV